jgi:hypothetical protein
MTAPLADTQNRCFCITAVKSKFLSHVVSQTKQPALESVYRTSDSNAKAHHPFGLVTCTLGSIEIAITGLYENRKVYDLLKLRRRARDRWARKR